MDIEAVAFEKQQLDRKDNRYHWYYCDCRKAFGFSWETLMQRMIIWLYKLS